MALKIVWTENASEDIDGHSIGKIAPTLKVGIVNFMLITIYPNGTDSKISIRKDEK